MKRVIIFDFDGVLADSDQTVFKMNQEAALSVNRTLTMEEYMSCFEGHINQGLQALLNLTEEEKQRLVDVKAGLFPKYYNPENVKLFSFAKELVVEASRLGELWIVSSSPSELILKVLETYGLESYFTKIVGQNRQPKSLFFQDAFGDKKDIGVFFITDTTGDIKEARKGNVDFLILAVTWGFHSASLLETENPDILVRQPNEILDFIRAH